MRRAIRFAKNSPIFLSLLLCVATCAMWVRSHYRADFLYHTTGTAGRPTALGVLDYAGIVQCEIATDTDIQIMQMTATGWRQERSGAWDWGSAVAEDDFDLLQGNTGLGTGSIGIRTAKRQFLGFGGGREVYPFSFGMYSGKPPPDGVCRFIQFPHWSLACMTGLLPLNAAWRAYRKRRAPAPGRCPACGYDLRASPERCPKCGRVATVAKANA